MNICLPIPFTTGNSAAVNEYLGAFIHSVTASRFFYVVVHWCGSGQCTPDYLVLLPDGEAYRSYACMVTTCFIINPMYFISSTS